MKKYHNMVEITPFYGIRPYMQLRNYIQYKHNLQHSPII